TVPLPASVTWDLETTFGGEGGIEEPPTITTWAYKNAAATEDTAFKLSDMITGEVDAQSTAPNILTITISDLPADTQVSGMTHSFVEGLGDVWTASVTTEDGDDSGAVQAALKGLMDGIEITPPPDANDNNLAEYFAFKATLTTVVVGGNDSNAATIERGEMEIPVTPLTDEAEFVIVLGDADDDGKLTESATEIPIELTVSSPDGEHGNIV